MVLSLRGRRGHGDLSAGACTFPLEFVAVNHERVFGIFVWPACSVRALSPCRTLRSDETAQQLPARGSSLLRRQTTSPRPGSG